MSFLYIFIHVQLFNLGLIQSEPTQHSSAPAEIFQPTSAPAGHISPSIAVMETIPCMSTANSFNAKY